MSSEYLDNGTAINPGTASDYYEARTTTAIVNTVFQVGGVDIATLYEKLASGTQKNNTTNFVTDNSTHSNKDLDELFAGYGTVSTENTVSFDSTNGTPASPDYAASKLHMSVSATAHARVDLCLEADGDFGYRTVSGSISSPGSVFYDSWDSDAWILDADKPSNPTAYEYRCYYDVPEHGGTNGFSGNGSPPLGTNDSYNTWTTMPSSGYVSWYSAASDSNPSAGGNTSIVYFVLTLREIANTSNSKTVMVKLTATARREPAGIGVQ